MEGNLCTKTDSMLILDKWIYLFFICFFSGYICIASRKKTKQKYQSVQLHIESEEQ